MNQLKLASSGKTTKEIKKISEKEGISTDKFKKQFQIGQVIIPKNRFHEIRNPCGIGDSTTTKVDANYGTGWGKTDLETELQKMETAIEYGADVVMDLSLGGNLDDLRKQGIKKSGVPFGTVPIYQAAITAITEAKNIADMTPEIILETIKKQAKQGVDFMTIHAGILYEATKKLKKSGRIAGICSRGGSLLAEYMILNKKENPLLERFDEILDIASKYDITLSIGSALRSGAIHDSTDMLQLGETVVTAELHKRALEANVQSMIEGPGHMVMSDIPANVKLIKKMTNNAPLYFLGPIVLDVATGYDNIVAAIGGSIAAHEGTNLLCYVTSVEHIRVPTLDEVRMGVISSKIAAHAADVSKGNPVLKKWNEEMSKARHACDWKKQKELSMDPKKFEEEFSKMPVNKGAGCTLCGEFCAYRKIRGQTK